MVKGLLIIQIVFSMKSRVEIMAIHYCMVELVVVVVVVVVSNLYSHDSQWPIRDNSVRKEKELLLLLLLLLLLFEFFFLTMAPSPTRDKFMRR